MRALAVMSHFDVGGCVAPHVLRHARALAAVADRVVVVSTAALDDEAAAPLREVAEVLVRPNIGYDFYSWRIGLSSVEDLGAYDAVITCNDSYVGPLVPYRTVLRTMRERPVDFWGLTVSQRLSPHVQSFFVCYRPWVVRSRAFTRFWKDMTPLSDRVDVIKRYEIGLSTSLADAGFRFGSYFSETPQDARLARQRHVWWALRRSQHYPKGTRRANFRRLSGEPWNPASALADRALDAGRLPYVKLDTLRYDPYQLGSRRLLRLCEQAYPSEFSGVREFLQRTAYAYPPRPGSPGPGDVPVGARGVLGYHS